MAPFIRAIPLASRLQARERPSRTDVTSRRRLRRSAEIIGPKKITQRRTVIGNCRTCGGHVMAGLPAVGLIDVFSATIHDFPFRPQLHVNYAETVLPMRDGLPKLRDFPAEMGGSGEVIAESGIDLPIHAGGDGPK